MTTWFPNTERTWLERLIIRILSQGVIPKHIAFIMDGNRRFAKKLNQEKIQGHSQGFIKLTETSIWCRDLGITQATLYAFSIENFKRSKEEVDYLMDLFRKQMLKVFDEMSKIKENEICIRIYGNIELLPIDIQKGIARMVIETSQFKRFYLNICFAYTSREEICNAFNDLQQCIDKQIIESTDINYETITNSLYSLGEINDPDILIRTSGEIRLSDFQLWQSSFSTIFFLNTLWPEFTIWHLFAAILNYQFEYQTIKKSRENYYRLIQMNDEKYCRKIYENDFNNNNNNDAKINCTYEEFLRKRNQRINDCYNYIKNKRLQRLHSLINR